MTENNNDKNNDKKRNTPNIIVLFLAIMLVFLIAMIISSILRSPKKDAIEEKVTLNDITDTIMDVSGNEQLVSATPVYNVDDIESSLSQNNIEYPEGYEEMWNVNEDGTQWIFYNGDVYFRDECEKKGIILNPKDFEQSTGVHEEYDEYWNPTKYPINVYFSPYPASSTYFIDDVPLAMSIEVLENQHEKFLPWLIEQGFRDEIYLLYYGTIKYPTSSPKYGINESIFKILDKETYNEWNQTQDSKIYDGKEEIWITFDEGNGKLTFDLK